MMVALMGAHGEVQVCVKNEETIQIQKVPVLGDMPRVGSLFKSTVSTNKKVETLIFITPRILSEVLLD